MPLNHEEPSFQKLTQRERKLLRIPDGQSSRTQVEAVTDQAQGLSKRKLKVLEKRFKHGAAEWE